MQKKKTAIFYFVSFIGGILVGLVICLAIINNRADQQKKTKFEKEIGVESKGYKRRDNCQFCQAAKLLGLEEKDLPDLTQKERIGAVSNTFLWETALDDDLEFLELEWLAKSSREKVKVWNELTGVVEEHVVILKKSTQKLTSAAEVDNKLVINFRPSELPEINDYYQKSIEFGVKKLFEIKPDLVWEWDVYCFFNNDVTGYCNGVPLLLALYSAYYQKPIPDYVIATGGIDEEGNVERVFGIHDKIIAAVESGKKTLIFPADNWDSTANKLVFYDTKEHEELIPDEKLAEFNQNYGGKLNYRPVKNWQDLIDLLERGF